MNELSSEDRGHIAHTLLTPGWKIVLREILLPALWKEAHLVDMMRDGNVHYHQGRKQALQGLIEQLYAVADIDNPLVVHKDALLTSLSPISKRQEMAEGEAGDGDQASEGTVLPRRRPSFPVF